MKFLVMRKNLKRQATRIATVVKNVRWDSVLPFTEKPSDDRNLPSESPSKQAAVSNNPSASDLFSMFTADIIREDVVFTR